MNQSNNLWCWFNPGGVLTAEIEQVSVEEGFPVELLNVQDGGSFQAAAQGLL